MNIFPSDWIQFGPGWLYGAPFIGKNFLYRLSGITYSLLFREEQAVTDSMIERDVETRTITIKAGGQPRKKPESILLHVAQSEVISLRELIEVTPIQIKLIEGSRKTQYLDKITVTLEPWQLLMDDMLAFDYKMGLSETTYEIVDSCYKVRAPHMLRRLFNPEKGKKGVGSDCWRISIMNNQDNQCYDLCSNYDWHLTVVNLINGKGEAGYVGHLERKAVQP